MTGWIILGTIILFIAFLLNMKLRAEIRFYGGKLDFKVKYLFFTIFPFKEKKKKPKKESPPPKEDVPTDSVKSYSGEEPYTVSKAEVEAKREAIRKEEESAEEVRETVKGREKLSEKIDKITDLIEKAKIIWGLSKKGLTRLFKHIYIDGIIIDFVIAEGDAYDTAMRYGTVNAVTYNAINAVRLLFPVTVKAVDIACDFGEKGSRYDGELKVTISPATILSAAFSILFGLLRNYGRLTGKTKKRPDAKRTVTT